LQSVAIPSDFMEIHPDEDSAAGAPAAAGNTGRQS
jgi:hypothetical protein